MYLPEFRFKSTLDYADKQSIRRGPPQLPLHRTKLDSIRTGYTYALRTSPGHMYSWINRSVERTL